MSKKEIEKEEETIKKDYKNKTIFINVSEKQICPTFLSKSKKDKEGNPFRLARILLPGSKYSQNTIGEGASIVVPEFTILDDKFKREGRKVISIDPDRVFEVHLKAIKKEDGTYDNKSVKVTGEELKRAFSAKEKEKAKEIQK
ncbi:MAG: hypothetical protein RR945_01555 [Erysipelotrichaceae bacterium]